MSKRSRRSGSTTGPLLEGGLTIDAPPGLVCSNDRPAVRAYVDTARYGTFDGTVEYDATVTIGEDVIGRAVLRRGDLPRFIAVDVDPALLRPGTAQIHLTSAEPPGRFEREVSLGRTEVDGIGAQCR